MNFWEGKQVIITGGTGFIGAHLRKSLSLLGTKVVAFGSKTCDLTDCHNTSAFFNYGIRLLVPKADFIFHLASWTQPGDFCLHHPAEQYDINTRIHANVITAWSTYCKDAKFVGAGTSCAYPGHLVDLKEEDYWIGMPHESLLTYAMTKRSLYAGQMAYGRQYGMKSIHPIFATVYGPGDYFGDQKSHCCSALIKRFCVATAKGLPEVVVWGDGSQRREFVHINDQIDGLLLAAEKYDNGLINLGAGHSTSISELSETIAECCGYCGKIVYDPTKFVGIREKCLDSTRAKEAIGWEPKISLKDGIASTVKWYTENRLQSDIGGPL